MDKRITILYLIDFITNREGLSGGTERQLVQLVNRIDKKIFRPIVVSLRNYAKSTLWDSLDCEKHILHVQSLLSADGFLKWFKFLQFVRKNKIDIIQTFFFDSTVYGITAARLAGVINTISCRRDMGFWYDNKLKNKMKQVNRFTKRVLVNSNAIKSFTILEEKVPKDKIDVIYNGIDLFSIDRTEGIRVEEVFKNIKKEDRIIGVVGNYNRKIKRFDLFLKAAAEVIKRHKDIKFMMVGGGTLENELRELVSELGIDEKVIFVGKVDDAIHYIKSFYVGVLPSDSEGFPNVLLEYMACGVPAVATSVGGNIELIEDKVNGLLVPRGDPVALSDAICELIKRGEIRSSICAKAREIVCRRFSWNQKVSEYQSYYVKLVEDARFPVN